MALLPADLRGIRFFVKHSYPGPPDTVRPKPVTISIKEANSNPAQSSIQRQLLSLGLPVALNHASLALMQLVDAWLAGKMGSVHLAAITPAGLLVAAWAVLGSEMLSSVTTLGSQSIGQGRPGAAGLYTWQGICIGVGFSFLCLMTVPTASSAFNFIFASHTPQMIGLETVYYQVAMLGLLPQLVSCALGNFFAAIQRTKVLLVSTLAGVLINGWLSYGLGFGKMGMPNLGFAGLAWGTVFASFLQMGILLCWFLSSKSIRNLYQTNNIAFSWKRIVKSFRNGIPSGIHSFVDFISWGILVTWLISFFGTAHIAAQTIMVRCITLCYLPAHGLSSALTTMVGQSVGARNYLLARRQAKAALVLNAGWMTGLALLMVCFRNPIINLFTQDPEIVAVCRTAILWVAGFQFFDAMNVTYADALQGAGDTFWPSCVNLTLALVILLGGGLAMVVFFPEDQASGVWAVATLYVAAHGLIYALRWKGRAWQDRRFLA